MVENFDVGMCNHYCQAQPQLQPQPNLAEFSSILNFSNHPPTHLILNFFRNCIYYIKIGYNNLVTGYVSWVEGGILG